ncbi:10726_t:CDS:2 [Dentiscutata heterogama]|uniref:10726_t:CDS:1 n=1 Tax=Dentiscutata heterogama TaxID=1316150 RepID=A0ACA9KFJ9_9GLOM|nr:10726_t:CDS:2 [Dentiscutata heterogama]
MPELISKLIVKCWDAKPENRPSSEELYDTLDGYYNEILNQSSAEFNTQINKADEASEEFLISSPTNTGESRFTPLNNVVSENSESLLIPQDDQKSSNFSIIDKHEYLDDRKSSDLLIVDKQDYLDDQESDNFSIIDKQDVQKSSDLLIVDEQDYLDDQESGNFSIIDKQDDQKSSDLLIVDEQDCFGK